jgi:hypothetical protein
MISLKRSSKSTSGNSFDDAGSLLSYSSRSAFDDSRRSSHRSIQERSSSATATTAITTTTTTTRSISTCSSGAIVEKDEDRSKEASTHSHSSKSIQRTNSIAVFGGQGTTGKHFLRLALDAGYHVRALVPPTGNKQQLFDDQPAFTKLEGSLDDVKLIQKALEGVDYVVCLLNDTLPTKTKYYPKQFLAGFVRRLYPLMKQERSIKVFLYQVSCLLSLPTVESTCLSHPSIHPLFSLPLILCN